MTTAYQCAICGDVTEDGACRCERRSPLDIWKTLTNAQRATLVEEIDPVAARKFGFGCGAARHALARRGLLVVGPTISAPNSGPGWHTPRTVTDLGRAVAAAGLGVNSP